ncbi:hypothetical protein V8F20_000632 [Naviculisporaceae sp. PSN 640]
MLSRPALSIRRLISHKNKAGVEVDEDPFYLPDEIDTIKAAYKDGKARTWKTPLIRRPNSKLTFDIPRSEDIHRISLIPPFPDTPHSSRSSLCSCENGTGHESTRSSPGLPHHKSPRSSPLLRPRQAEQMHQGRGSSRSPPRIPMEPPHSPPPTPQPSQHRATPEPDSDSSPRSSNDEEDLAPEATEQYLDKLIRETDEAFKLQDAFVDAKLPSPGLPEHRESFQVQGEVPLPLTPTRPTRARSQRLGQSSSLKSPTKGQVKMSFPPNAVAARSIPSKTKRTRSKKSRRRSRATTSQPSRWTESAKDLIKSRLFSRIEADEMLPESTLQEIRMSRASHRQQQWAKYTDSVVTDVETDQSGTRKDSLNAKVVNPPPTIIEQVDTPRSSVSKNSDEIDRDDCATPKPEPQHQQPTLDIAADAGFEFEDDEDTLPIMMTMDDSKTQTSAAPPPPPKRNSPRRLPSRQLPPLPTIPEVIATGPDNTILSPTSTPGSALATKINKDDYVFLQSTKYTLTKPFFRHGPIRLAKADLPIGKPTVDDTLDWTAFQMAILGGAGDFFSEPTDYSRPSDAELKELEEIANWFDSFGLGGPGSLVTEADAPLPTPADRPRSLSSYRNSSSRNSPRAAGKRRSSRISPGVIQSQRAQVQEMQQRRPNAAIIPSSRMSVEAPIPVPPLMAEAQPRRYLFAGAALAATANSRNSSNGSGSASLSAAPRTLNHIGLAIDSSRRPSVESVQSLPQSPMLDLVVSRDVAGDEYVVPMGFNLGHDLGDFLKWEAENVFAPGYGLEQ